MYSTEKTPHKTIEFNLTGVHPSWHACITEALQAVDIQYRESLYQSEQWLPGKDKIFSAFSLPVEQVNYILFGESPYPRAVSANGYAFWDNNVGTLWSETGLSKPVNRATSLRNIIKMLLIAEGALDPKHTGQDDIAKLDKQHYIQTNTELFQHLLNHGFLLLNASLVLQDTPVKKDARAWQPFLKKILEFILANRPNTQCILLGNIANEIDPLIPERSTKKLYAEHPYNLTFISNPNVIQFFQPLHLLRQSGKSAK